ncbi:MAG: MurR/RpiR family transcriptional regulator [Rhodobacteraceae bacterium]|nr:MurR/RpiR family transcriptional regulator [Paracoccaceae bacterium]
MPDLRPSPHDHHDLAALCRALERLSVESAPQVAALARWLASHPEELAFDSVRGLAARANTNANTVIRLVRALGYPSYEQARSAAQFALRRAAGLDPGTGVVMPQRGLADFQPALQPDMRDCAGMLLRARHVLALGVRSCFALAHYFSYAGAMAFHHIQPAPAQPGLILDHISAVTPEDAVLVMSYAHYSSEVLRGAALARERGAHMVAITDRADSPLAEGASHVFVVPMAGTARLPSLAPAMLLIERLLAEMARQDTGAAARISEFEERLLRAGGYRR